MAVLFVKEEMTSCPPEDLCVNVNSRSTDKAGQQPKSPFRGKNPMWRDRAQWREDAPPLSGTEEPTLSDVNSDGSRRGRAPTCEAPAHTLECMVEFQLL